MAKLTKRQKKQQQEFRAPVKLTPKHVTPITTQQKNVFESFRANKHMFLHGLAGTGKTFLSMFLALDDVTNEKSDQTRVVIVRSVVPTRDMGFLPGTAKEKAREYEAPYMAICTELFGRSSIYEELKLKGQLQFITTSFIRGTTIDNAIVIVDECSNLTFHELDSIITRIGKNSRIIFSGDFTQSDLKESDKKGFSKFVSIIRKMNLFDFIEFGVQDIVRGPLVKQYIIQKHRYESGPS